MYAKGQLVKFRTDGREQVGTIMDGPWVDDEGEWCDVEVYETARTYLVAVNEIVEVAAMQEP